MREIEKLIVHCADTPGGIHFDVEDIRRWHTLPKPKGNGWNDVGYHYIILLDGTIQKGREDSVIGSHCKGDNSHSIGICYIGGKGGDTRTPEQKTSLVYLIGYLKNIYRTAEVFGHRDFSTKPCPQFDAKTEYKNV